VAARTVIDVLTLEETINLILKHTEYQRQDVLNMIEEKRQELGPDVVNDESAAMIVARDLGIDLHQLSAKPRMRIEDISESTRNVTLTAKVINVGPVRTFTRKDEGGEGKVGSLVIADKTGQIRVTLWDEVTKAISEDSDESIRIDDVIQLRGGYVRRGLGENLEIQMGRMSGIKRLDEHDLEDLEIDVGEPPSKKISDLQEREFNVTLLGKVMRIFPLSTFTRKTDGTEGKVQSLIVADETGDTRLVFWDKDAEEIEDVTEGEVIRVRGGNTKRGRYGNIEVHVGRSAQIERKLDIEIDTGESKPSAGAPTPVGKKQIGEITTQMKDVDLDGRVVRIFPVNTFEKEGGEGRVQNLIVADESAQIRLTFWNEDVDKIKDIKEGDVIRVTHAYAKEGFRGGVEVHVGRRAEIKVNPRGSSLKKLDLSDLASSPSLDAFEPIGKKLIGEITIQMRDVDLEGKVVTISPVNTFDKDGKEGRVQNLIIADQSAQIRLTFWNEDVDKIKDIKEGDVIRVAHAYAKEGFGGGVEVHVGRNAEIKINPRGSPLKKLDVSNLASSPTLGASEPVGKKEIAEITTQMKDVDLEGKVVKIFPVNTFERDGGEGRVQNIIIADESAQIRLTFWNEDVDKIKDLQEEDVVSVTHAYAKEGFRGGVEVHLGRRAELKINPEGSPLKQLDLSDLSVESKSQAAGAVRIREIGEESEGKSVEVSGIVVGATQGNPVYPACPSCLKKVEEEGGKFTCSVCGAVKEPEYRMFYKVTVDDGSGSIGTTLFGETGEKLLGMTAGEAHKLITKSGNEREPLERNSDRLLGRYVSVRGRVSMFRDTIEITASGLDFPNLVEVSKRERERIDELIG
jgi:replication factor A1